MADAVSATDERRCAACRWWGRTAGDRVPGTEFGVDPSRFGRCRAITRASADAGAIVFVHDPYEEAMLLTTAEFGCVRWEAGP